MEAVDHGDYCMTGRTTLTLRSTGSCQPSGIDPVSWFKYSVSSCGKLGLRLRKACPGQALKEWSV